MSIVKDACGMDKECQQKIEKIPWKILPTLTGENPETTKILKMLEQINDEYGDQIEPRIRRLTTLYIKTLKKKIDEELSKQPPIEEKKIDCKIDDKECVLVVDQRVEPIDYTKKTFEKNKNLSCYINSTLWALLHTTDNPLINKIRKSELYPNPVQAKENKRECDNTRLKDYLIEYYDKIQGLRSIGHFPTDNIRKFLQDCSYEFGVSSSKYDRNYWLNQQLDNNEFLRKILDHFKFKTLESSRFKQIEINIYSNSTDKNAPPTFIRERELDEELPIYQWNVGSMNELSIINVDPKFKLNGKNNDFMIVGSDEVLDQGILLYVDGMDVVYNNSRHNVLFRNPDMLIITLNRTQFDKHTFKETKNTSAINIDFNINHLNLKSIVVHHGINIKSGHFIVYVNNGNKWFLVDDISTKIVEVDIESKKIKDDITKNSTTLVYY